MSASRRAGFGLSLAVAFAFIATASAYAQGIETPRVPLRTAIKELNTLRAEYADLYNKKDVAALVAMYSGDAVVVRADGSTLVGQQAIGKALAQDAPTWKPMVIASDTMRVFGNTAWDIGTLTTRTPTGDPSVSHYLVVLRRGIQTWKVSSLALVPGTTVTATK
jgi:ketosteroid isomerase-like protein